MSPPLSLLERLPPSALERIAFYTGSSESLGPPTDLVALLSASRTLYNALSFTTNKHLWGVIYKLKFDTKAISRRLGARWTTLRCLAQEGLKRYAVMNRIRRKIVAEKHHLSDLWTCYIMFLENDGRNERQLVDWADIRQFLYKVISYRAFAPPESPCSWFQDTEGTALTVWLLWMTATPESIRAEHPQLRAEIRGLLYAFVVVGYRYPSCYAPDSHFDLPLCSAQKQPAPHTAGPPSKITKLVFYGRELTVTAPPLTPAAFLVSTIRAEATQDNSPLPAQTATLPANREIANALGQTGKTVEDVREFHYNVRTPLLEPCTCGDPDASTQVIDSARHDEDWCRLVSCYDPWADQPVMRGKVYTLGSLNRLWDGRLLIPHAQHYWTSIVNPQTPASSIGFSQERMAIEFQEHHCLSPDTGILPGTDETGWGDDILNAWLPQGVTVSHFEDAVELRDPASGQQTRYETYFPDRPLPYSKAACDKLHVTWKAGNIIEDDSDDEAEEGAKEAEQVPYTDDDDEYEDTVDHLITGVRDILITGKTRDDHGAAWGQFNILGRVRFWDGLCVFIRTPTNPHETHFGRWIFKGYIHADRLVGRWRETSTSVQNIGWEGGFVLCKTRES